MSETPAASPSGTPAAGQAAAAADPAATAAAASTTTAASPSGIPAAGQAATGTGTTTAATTAAAAAPERYELRLPEQTLLDQSDVDAITALAKTKAWTNDQAQTALTEMHTTLSEQATRFRTELTADPEVGGAHLEHAQVLALRALDRFLPATEEDGQRLRSVMNKSGYGNFRPLVKFLARIGKAMSEDQPGAGGTSRVFTETKRSQADRLFGDAQGIRPGT